MDTGIVFTLSGPSFSNGAEVDQLTQSLREFKKVYSAATKALIGAESDLYVVSAKEGSLITALFPALVDTAQHAINLLPHISTEKLLEVWHQLSIGEVPNLDKPTLSNIEALREAYGVAKSLRKVFLILRNKDDKLQITKNGQTVLSGDNSTASMIAPPKSLPEKDITLQKVNLAIKQPDLTGDEKWRFIYDGRVIVASVVESEYRSRVANREETFAAGDIIQCDLQVKREQSGQRTKVKYSVIRVHKKYRPASDDQKRIG